MSRSIAMAPDAGYALRCSPRSRAAWRVGASDDHRVEGRQRDAVALIAHHSVGIDQEEPGRTSDERVLPASPPCSVNGKELNGPAFAATIRQRGRKRIASDGDNAQWLRACQPLAPQGGSQTRRGTIRSERQHDRPLVVRHVQPVPPPSTVFELYAKTSNRVARGEDHRRRRRRERPNGDLPPEYAHLGECEARKQGSDNAFPHRLAPHGE